MMRCSRVRKVLSPYMDGELSEKRALRIRDHVAQCAACREALKALQNLDALSRKRRPQEPSEVYWAGFLQRLHKKIEAATPHSFWEKAGHALRSFVHPSSPWFRTAGAVASLVLLFIVGRAIMMGTGTEKVPFTSSEDVLERHVGHEAKGAEEKESEVKEKSSPDLPTDEGKERLLAGAREEEAVPPQMEKKAKGVEGIHITATTDRKREEVLNRGPKLLAPSGEMYSATGSAEPQWIYEQALSLQRRGDSDAAAAQFQRILDNYASSQVADDAQFQLNLSRQSAMQASLTLESWQKQRDMWQDFLQKYPHSDLGTEACLKLAESWYEIATITQTTEDLSQALEANRSCQGMWREEEVLKRQARELRRKLKREEK